MTTNVTLINNSLVKKYLTYDGHNVIVDSTLTDAGECSNNIHVYLVCMVYYVLSMPCRLQQTLLQVFTILCVRLLSNYIMANQIGIGDTHAILDL